MRLLLALPVLVAALPSPPPAFASRCADVGQRKLTLHIGRRPFARAEDFTGETALIYGPKAESDALNLAVLSKSPAAGGGPPPSAVPLADLDYVQEFVRLVEAHAPTRSAVVPFTAFQGQRAKVKRKVRCVDLHS
jgi:hypothetical protein